MGNGVFDVPPPRNEPVLNYGPRSAERAELERMAGGAIEIAPRIGGPRITTGKTVNAATMLGQSKTVFQAEIDAACEPADFWRFNVDSMRWVSPRAIKETFVPAAHFACPSMQPDQ